MKSQTTTTTQEKKPKRQANKKDECAILKEVWFQYYFGKFAEQANKDLKKSIKNINNNVSLSKEEKKAEIKKLYQNQKILYDDKIHDLMLRKDDYKNFYERIMNSKN